MKSKKVFEEIVLDVRTYQCRDNQFKKNASLIGKKRYELNPEKMMSFVLSQKGKKQSEETIRKRSESLMNHECSEETILKMKKIKMERYSGENHPSKREDVRRKISIATKGENNPMYNVKPTEEQTRKKVMSFKKTLELHPEIRERMSLAKKGISLSEEHKIKIGISGKGRICSKETRLKFSLAQSSEEVRLKKSLASRGEKNGNWQGGKSFEEYGLGFNKSFKNKIRHRDNQICMICGIHREKLNISLCVHHINYDKKLSIPQNCISLCNHCHLKTNINREEYIAFFQSILSKLYGYKYENRKPIIELK